MSTQKKQTSQRAWYKTNKVRIDQQQKEYRENNRELLREKAKAYRKNKPDIFRTWAKANNEHLKEYKRNWRRLHKDKFTKQKQARKKNDPIYHVNYNIGSNIRTQLKRHSYSKQSRTYQIIGCTYDELKLHLEAQFESWMNWDNYGNWNGTPNQTGISWDIDHIIPLSTAETYADVIRLNHYTNLRPLDSYINRWIKSNKMEAA